MENLIIKRIQEEISQLHKAIEEERKARKENEDLIISMINEMGTKLGIQLENERKERETTQREIDKVISALSRQVNAAEQAYQQLDSTYG